MGTDRSDVIVHLDHVSKKFGGIYALSGVDFELKREIHSIVGHNGAGKSTLVKILMGALQPEEGQIFLHNQPVSFSSPREAQNSHISMVWQELANFPNLSITENLLMQRFIYKKSGGINWKASHEQCRQYLERINLSLDPRMPMNKLSLAQQQLVEFAKALSYDPAVLILDEPTSALSFTEQEVLYEKVRLIKSQGVAVVFISHKLDEIINLSDRITVLRDGKKIFTKCADELNREQIVEAIVGNPAKKETREFTVRDKTAAPAVMQVSELELERRLNKVSFELHVGEVLGITGVSGSGITEIGRILFGLERGYTGEIWLDGKPYRSDSPREAVSLGLGYVPKNRKEEGIVPGMSVGDNIVLSALNEICKGGLVDRKRRSGMIEEIMDTVDLKPRDPGISIGSLSGGNQQKGVIARWISKKAKVLILDEPTRGVDVGAIHKIYSLIRQLAESGLSVIIISSEFEEVHDASDRILVLNKGTLVGELDSASNSWEEVFALAVK